jgi:ornithine cyclodeaminase
MTKIITLKNVQQILKIKDYKTFSKELQTCLEEDFKDWGSFQKNSRIAFYTDQGVMELMPICGSKMFSYKYVNGHPNNPNSNKLTVVGSGLLADNQTGEPILISEMTLLTALRTGATSALASKYLAKKSSTKLGIIGCGSQSEFQVLAHLSDFKIEKVYFYDCDKKAMQKFADNLNDYDFELIFCTSAKEAVENCDIITTCTAQLGHFEIIKQSWLKKGQHINAIGGDSENKSELETEILKKADKLVVEYFEQTKVEGEIKNLKNPEKYVDCELWEIISGKKKGRQDETEITVFDGVGFALEDYSALRYINDVSEKLRIYESLDMVPELQDCKNLFGLVKNITKVKNLEFTSLKREGVLSTL